VSVARADSAAPAFKDTSRMIFEPDSRRYNEFTRRQRLNPIDMNFTLSGSNDQSKYKPKARFGHGKMMIPIYPLFASPHL
jgi:hypothetical protein